MKIKNLLTQNSKMKKQSGLKTYNFGIPAYKEQGGKITCPNAGSCGKDGGCYALQGAYIWSNVAQAFQRRYELSLTDKFVSVMDAEIKKRKGIERVRVHDSGDFYSKSYAFKWFEIARLNPNVEFYAYTKMVKLFKSFFKQNLVPENFKIIYSFGGTQDSSININEDRHSAVFSSLEELILNGYSDASSDDDVATQDNKKVGLIYHGAKSKAWNAG